MIGTESNNVKTWFLPPLPARSSTKLVIYLALNLFQKE